MGRVDHAQGVCPGRAAPTAPRRARPAPPASAPAAAAPPYGSEFATASAAALRTCPGPNSATRRHPPRGGSTPAQAGPVTDGGSAKPPAAADTASSNCPADTVASTAAASASAPRTAVLRTASTPPNGGCPKTPRAGSPAADLSRAIRNLYQ